MPNHSERDCDSKTTLKPGPPTSGGVAFRWLPGFVVFAFCVLGHAQDQATMPTILVINYSQASSGTVKLAEEEAGLILAQAGVRTSWFNCPTPSSTRPPSICDNEQGPGEIRVRILSGKASSKFADGAFGFAIAPVFATVYYEPTVQLATSHSLEFEVAPILGCMVAHEIGHLLLGPNSHSVSGIMQGRWEAKQVQQLLKGALVFNKQQAALMRAEVQRRIEGQGTERAVDTLSFRAGESPVESKLARP